MPRCAPLTVDRIPATGGLLLTMPTGPGGRTPLLSMISQDEGETWTHRRNILDDPSECYGYQSVDFIDDMAVITCPSNRGIEVFWFYEGSEQ